MKRWQGEIVAAAILVVVMGGGWLWERSRLAGDLRAQREAGERTEAAVRAAATEWASGLATSEAEASFNAFLAGIGDRVRFPDSRSLEESIDRYLRLDAVRFVHVMGADGSILASTDRKLVWLEIRVTNRPPGRNIRFSSRSTASLRTHASSASQVMIHSCLTQEMI